MKNIINYFNDNAFVASLITFCLSTIVTIVINIIDKKIDRKDKEKDNKKNEFQNKGELRIEKYKTPKINDQINEMMFTWIIINRVSKRFTTHHSSVKTRFLNFFKSVVGFFGSF